MTWTWIWTLERSWDSSSIMGHDIVPEWGNIVPLFIIIIYVPNSRNYLFSYFFFRTLCGKTFFILCELRDQMTFDFQPLTFDFFP